MKIKINNEIWKIRLHTPEQFLKVLGDDYSDTGAVTDTETREIFFRTDQISEEIVRHELFHCYFNFIVIDSVELDNKQVEEYSATIVGKFGEDLIKNSKKIYKYLIKKVK